MVRTKGVLIFLEKFLGSRELSFGKPRVFFGRIILPSDKVLPTERSSFVTNDLLNFIMFLIINEIRGWSREVPSMNFIFMIRR